MGLASLRRSSVAIAVLTVLLLLPAVVLGQDGRVYLSGTDGLIGGEIPIGFGPVAFTFNFHNLDTLSNLEWFNSGFVLSGSDDLQWTCNYGFHPDYISVADFDLLNGHSLFSWDGTGSDTIGFYGVTLFGSGLPAGFNGGALVLYIEVEGSSHWGKEICIDSVSFPLAGTWMWKWDGLWDWPWPADTGYTSAPTWDGPWCFGVTGSPCYGCSCCGNEVGNVNGDIDGIVDISDLTLLVNYLFVTYQALPCPAEANITGGSGCYIDISDLTALVNHLFVTYQWLPWCIDCPYPSKE